MKLIFDREALEQAKLQLDIKLPVKIRIVTERQIGYRGGSHRFKDGRHYIEISDTAYQINYIMWHELTHCSQAERVLDEGEKDFHKVYKQYAGEGGASYLNNTFEIEARKIAKENINKLLVRIEQ